MSQGGFIPKLWADEMLTALKAKSVFDSTPLDPKDTWGPSGEDYSDPVAWGKLLEVGVFRDGLGGGFRLHRAGHKPWLLTLLPPAALTEVIKLYAANVPFLEAEARIQAESGVRIGDIFLRR